MNTFSNRPGGLRGRSEYVGGRPASDANYSAKKKSFGGKKSLGGGKPSFGGKKSFGKPAFKGGATKTSPATMHKATCATCGAACEVPFRPDGSKPVFCRDCFAANPPEKRDSVQGRPRHGKDTAPRSYTTPTPVDLSPLTERLSAIESQLAQLTVLLERMTAPKAVAKKVAKEAIPEDAVVLTVGASPKAAPKKASPKKTAAKKTTKAAAKKK